MRATETSALIASVWRTGRGLFAGHARRAGTHPETAIRSKRDSLRADAA
jgi:hypothetical protein